MGNKYKLPDVRITDNWQAHRNRNSAEPGTDFALPYGSKVYAPYAGTVRVTHTVPATATGRYVGIDLSDGNYFRALHLSSIAVRPGQKVKKGALIGYSGASGFGKDWYYGPHVHFSLWVNSDPLKSSFKATTDIVAYSKAHAPSLTKKKVRRVTVKVGSHGRQKPTTKSHINQLLKGPGDFKGYVRGQTVEGNNVWFVGAYSGDYFWSGGFTNKSTKGMKRLD